MTPAEQKARRIRAAEAQKVRRARAKAAGLCGVCCHARTVGGRFQCDECAAKQKGYLALNPRRKREGGEVPFCLECLAANFHRAGCVAWTPVRTEEAHAAE